MIVEGGSAGSALANCLSADPGSAGPGAGGGPVRLLRDDYFGHYKRVLWLAQRPTLGTRLAAESAAAALDLPLEIREVGDAGLERALEPLVS